MERYFLVTAARRVGAARVNLFQKLFVSSNDDGMNGEESNSEPQIIPYRLIGLSFKLSDLEII